MRFSDPDPVRMTPDGRMDPRGAAVYLGLTEKTLAAKRSNGTGPRFVKVGRVFYFKADLDAWLENARATSTAQAATRRRGQGGNATVVVLLLLTIAAGVALFFDSAHALAMAGPLMGMGLGRRAADEVSGHQAADAALAKLAAGQTSDPELLVRAMSRALSEAGRLEASPHPVVVGFLRRLQKAIEQRP